mmetsp:Transcript_2538/g.3107  ORF Transcript_2538/g.3107 Transcript_2538/m.3107 type:complete len:130 (-) Transcript_2538:768-1157(-)
MLWMSLKSIRIIMEREGVRKSERETTYTHTQFSFFQYHSHLISSHLVCVCVLHSVETCPHQNRGEHLRIVSPTSLGRVSSRTQALFTFYVDEMIQGETVSSGKLQLWDMAGNERYNSSQPSTFLPTQCV